MLEKNNETWGSKRSVLEDQSAAHRPLDWMTRGAARWSVITFFPPTQCVQMQCVFFFHRVLLTHLLLSDVVAPCRLVVPINSQTAQNPDLRWAQGRKISEPEAIKMAYGSEGNLIIAATLACMHTCSLIWQVPSSDSSPNYGQYGTLYNASSLYITEVRVRGHTTMGRVNRTLIHY